jgi:PST family polysaccharide transporter
LGKKLFKYTITAVITAICGPLSSIIVREKLLDIYGNTQVGYWDAMCRFSGAYLILFTTIISYYFLPKLSSISSKKLILNEIIYGYKFILPIVGICTISSFLARDFIIHLLFTKDFLGMRDLFFWYMVGDFLKIGSWILTYLLLAKSMIKEFIALELVFTFSYVILNIFLIDNIGFIGVGISYALNYLVYWLVIILLLKIRLAKYVQI